ncbi:hypothetical protein Gasu2_21950 [Galdieria sulphuraria]|uniref:Uncharacterized protein n=1 Tax=Galdieria sulphuraria TaxID=130081 RepID=M2XQY6_GALSU|nr:uncharacterized protein Gasu_00340 [Galdieria sulphuraria]EME32662.1 hypothetical protein Gasu_00340 [Galdieria sulphuraria]GJD07866.1 hypothetical protein Gasu2_21950 [Galdieria sulphuraria]|eukprot:XP_005709182.1 hypothetical protein Gasu_00340 [Galdieria sulphuraria]
MLSATLLNISTTLTQEISSKKLIFYNTNDLHKREQFAFEFQRQPKRQVVFLLTPTLSSQYASVFCRSLNIYFYEASFIIGTFLLWLS